MAMRFKRSSGNGKFTMIAASGGGSTRRRMAVAAIGCWTLLAAPAQSQEAPAPEPYIPQSAFERPQAESGLEGQMRVCNDALGYLGCDQLWHGGKGGGGAPGIWGAVAISRSSTAYGYSYDYPSAESANSAALDKCNAGLKGKRDCQVRSTFARDCIALATSGDGAWGLSATYGDLVADDKDALGRCQGGGGKSCSTVLAYCSPNGGFHYWVGLAISNEARPKVGIAWGAPAQSGASKLALDTCIKQGGSKCKVRMLLHNQCIAYAESPNGMWGAYNNMTRKVAETNALRKCRESNGTNCTVLLSKCAMDPG